MGKEIVVYPVILAKVDEHYCVTIPGIASGFTHGKQRLDAIKFAMNLIGRLLSIETNYPRPPEQNRIQLKDNEQLIYVAVNLNDYRQMIDVAVEIPEALDHLASEKGLDLSAVMVAALKTKLNH
ncbi:hypothetical protein YK48G_06410 [Lentilactobacillus fungorum]|uniref:HicB family protein n=1 Tax=Lentilactobacillus fungorum TaxID=2201250 RepID=A0ABQ3VYF1_9LACO|nr:antitoxin HicB [Lentilactobacillus fungorum]GHP13216.1 hypothetical protein YK48G_06410 [Lentilactobacillus fungorum]